MIQITTSQNIPEGSSVVLLATATSDFACAGLTDEEVRYVQAQISAKSEHIAFNRCGCWFFVQPVPANTAAPAAKEKMRQSAAALHQCIARQRIHSLAIIDAAGDATLACAFAEGMVLANYQFLKYAGKKIEKQYALSALTIVGVAPDLDYLNITLEGVYRTRDLVNEPANMMTPALLAAEFAAMGRNAGVNVQVFGRADIEKMRMGGLLAVNRGSTEAPAFTVLEWKPANAVNSRPVVFVGKAITFDTGGHNLKTEGFMKDMKEDMAGGAVVATVVCAAAKAQLPVHVIGLIPSTDNRISPDACSPGDIVTMYDGSTVEITNTDAEGRVILADALAYAKQYNPELLVDVATLTGSASRALGREAMAMMSNAPHTATEQLIRCGESVYERLVEFPLWDEYAEYLKSDIADLKNEGGKSAGMITAGKFLEYFTAYPFIHIDIAGVAFANEAYGYQCRGGTGVGVRLLFELLRSYQL